MLTYKLDSIPIPLWVSLSVNQSVGLLDYWSVCLSVSPYVFPFVHMYIHALLRIDSSVFSDFGRSALVGECPMKSLLFVCSSLLLSIRLSVRPSVHPFVCPSLSFLKIGSFVFSDIVHDDSWPWYVRTDEARFLKKKKKKIVAWSWAQRPKSGLKWGFPVFSFLSLFNTLFTVY